MRYGPVPPKNLPVQDPAKVLLLAERWQRAAFAHERWATPAKEAVDMFEGRQWTETQLAEMKRQKRPALKFNIITPIVRLVQGYQDNNKTDIKYSPGQDTLSSEQVADALGKITKVIAKGSKMEFVGSEVFLDGIICARGWFDTRLDWETNDLGEAKTGALDPFTVYPDPDCSTYDVNETASFMQVAKMISMDEIEGNLGKTVAGLVRPWANGSTPLAPLSSIVVNDEVAPTRYFGLREDTQTDYWDNFYSLMGDFVDPHRKTIRAIETQYKVRELRNVVIDLETGDKKTLPDDWGADKIQKMLLWAETQGNPLTVQRRLVERIHWTTMVGDVIIYDAPSFYDSYTMTGYFPYFRRGVTRGMVEDLIDPQREKNKRRSARVEIDAKTANGGWMYHEHTLNPVQEQNLARFGSAPGVRIKYKGTEGPPVQIQAAQPPVGARILEEDADMDARRISGINEAALGNEDTRAVSGRAIEARQRQATISVQSYLNNFNRSLQLVGDRQLFIIQNFYTEQRLYRLTGDDGKETQAQINQIIQDPASGGKRIINDVTVGKYMASVDSSPLSATFAAAQYEEMMTLLEQMTKAGLPVGPFMDLVLAQSSMPNKEEWVKRAQQILGGQGKEQPAKPTESINFKDLPPEGQAQMAQQAGIQLTPMQIALHTASQKPPAQASGPAGNVVPLSRPA